MCAAHVGNQFWKARSKHGRDRLFASADLLWEACCEYFEWVEANPLIEMRPFAYQGVVIQEPVPKMRAMTKSRTKPRTLETRVMPLTVARDLSRFIFIGLLCLGCCAGPAGGVILRCSMRQGAWRLLKAGFGRRKIALRSRRLFCKILRFRLIH